MNKEEKYRFAQGARMIFEEKIARGEVEIDQSCYLCGSKKIKCLGCMVPDDSNKWPVPGMGKTPKGKQRVFFYFLCEDCFEKPNKASLVEGKIMIDTGMLPLYSYN